MTMSQADIRTEQIAGMRRMADWLEAHPDVPLDYGVSLTIYRDMDDARKIRAASVGGWEKSDSDYSFNYEQRFTDPELPDWRACAFRLSVAKSEDTCRRVQVGTRTVPAVEAQPEHEEPVYEWRCGPDAADAE